MDEVRTPQMLSKYKQSNISPKYINRLKPRSRFESKVRNLVLQKQTVTAYDPRSIFSVQALIVCYPEPHSLRPAFRLIRMTDKSQHATKEAGYYISGDPKSLNQLSSSGKAAQSRRGKTPAQKASGAQPSKAASSQGGDSAHKGGSDQKK